jgi:hypothetical protein
MDACMHEGLSFFHQTIEQIGAEVEKNQGGIHDLRSFLDCG